MRTAVSSKVTENHSLTGLGRARLRKLKIRLSIGSAANDVGLVLPSGRLRPRVVGSDGPDVALGVAAREVAAAVGLGFDVEEDFGAGFLCAAVDGVGVGDDEVGELGFAAADVGGLGH